MSTESFYYRFMKESEIFYKLSCTKDSDLIETSLVLFALFKDCCLLGSDICPRLPTPTEFPQPIETTPRVHLKGFAVMARPVC